MADNAQIESLESILDKSLSPEDQKEAYRILYGLSDLPV